MCLQPSLITQCALFILSLSLLVAKETTSFDGATAHWQGPGHDESSPAPLEEVLSHQLRAAEGLNQSHKVSQQCGWVSCDGHVTCTGTVM